MISCNRLEKVCLYDTPDSLFFEKAVRRNLTVFVFVDVNIPVGKISLIYVNENRIINRN